MNSLATKNDLRLAAFAGVAAGLTLIAACKKITPPTSTQTSEKTVMLPMPTSQSEKTTTTSIPPGKDSDMERVLEKHCAGKPAEKEAMRNTMTELDARLSAEDRLAEIRRRTMVTPAPSDFKPEPVARKVRLRLVIEKSDIRVREFPRYRLELQNVGQETIIYQEHSSSVFVKGGGLLNTTTMVFYLTDSHNKRKELLPPSVPRPAINGQPSRRRITPPSGLSQADMEKWFVEANAMGQAHATFKVKLLPGETLHSIGDDDSPVENFKTMYTDNYFYTPGSYKLHVELDDRPKPLSKRYIEFSLKSGSTLEQVRKWHAEEVRDALGPAISNAVTFEVTR